MQSENLACKLCLFNSAESSDFLSLCYRVLWDPAVAAAFYPECIWISTIRYWSVPAPFWFQNNFFYGSSFWQKCNEISNSNLIWLFNIEIHGSPRSDNSCKDFFCASWNQERAIKNGNWIKRFKTEQPIVTMLILYKIYTTALLSLKP